MAGVEDAGGQVNICIFSRCESMHDVRIPRTALKLESLVQRERDELFLFNIYVLLFKTCTQSSPFFLFFEDLLTPNSTLSTSTLSRTHSFSLDTLFMTWRETRF